MVKSFFLSPLFIVMFQGLQETSSYPKILLRKASAYKLGCEKKYLFLDFDMYLKLLRTPLVCTLAHLETVSLPELYF